MIYFIRHGNTDMIKVGYTDVCANARMRALQCGSPVPLTMIGFCEGSVYKEKRLQRMLSPNRISGEWYREDSEFTRIMQSVLDGSFDWSVSEKPGPKKRPSTEKYDPALYDYAVPNITFASAVYHHILRLFYGENEYYGMMPKHAIRAYHQGKTHGKPDWRSFVKAVEARGIDWRYDAPLITEVLSGD